MGEAISFVLSRQQMRDAREQPVPRVSMDEISALARAAHA